MPFPDQACTAFAQISDQNTAAVLSKASPCRVATTTTTAPATTTAAADVHAVTAASRANVVS